MNDKLLGLFGEEWYVAFEKLLKSEYWNSLMTKISMERRLFTVYPERGSDLIFKAFRTTPLSQTKVVILGQDPYHDGSYDGFAFSNKGKTSNLSPSLRNIFIEVENDLYNGLKLDQDPDLERWAKQGVLLINTAHTVRQSDAGSHLEEWKPFTKKVIEILLQKEKLVWMLWGKKASDLVDVNRAMEITKGKHLFIITSHPSPFSAHVGFFGSKPFSKANKYLEENGLSTINW